MNRFEDQLWSELMHEHGEEVRGAPQATAALAASVTATSSAIARGPLRRGPRHPALLTGTALSSAGLASAIVLALSATGSPPAYAVTENSDGTVTVTLRDLSAIPALNAKFAQEGINVKAVPLTADCPTTAPIQSLAAHPAGASGGTWAITINPGQIPRGDAGVLAARDAGSQNVEMVLGATPSPAPSCLNSTAYTTIGIHQVTAP